MEGKIPKNAKKVFQGILFDIYQWEQEMFNGTFETFEKAIRADSSQIIALTKKKELILLNEEQPHDGSFSGLIGGRIERDETPIENAKKELLEELGMKSENIFLWKVVPFNSKVSWDTYYFIAKNCEIVAEKNLESGEKIEEFYLTFEDFVKETQKDSFRNKEFQFMMYKLLCNKKELEKFKDLLLN
jgi:ADP-ribose pyrophosphatase